MKLNALHSVLAVLRRAGLGIGLTTFSVVMPSAAQEPSSQPPQTIQWDRQDVLVAEEAPLGSDEWRAQRLALSHRRHEMIKLPSGNRTLNAFVAYPDAKGKAPVILMPPEDQGLNNWARDMADQIASLGYIVIVPDFLSGFGPGGGGRSTFPTLKSVFATHSALSRQRDLLTGDLNVLADYGKKLEQFNGKLAVVGFAWGAGRAFWFATQRKDLTAAFIFYDWSPPAEELAKITAPVYGFYGETDTRVQNTIEATAKAMKTHGKKYEPVTYPGADHMFVRLGEEPGNSNPANVAARIQSMARLQMLLQKM